MTKVFIAPGDSYNAAIAMFERAGFTVVKDYEDVDLICFLGGTDVDPAIYGAERDPHTQSPDKQRDAVEVALYRKFTASCPTKDGEDCGEYDLSCQGSCQGKTIPKVGICRGGQLLNVLNGGKMIQHLGKCISGDVEIDLSNEFGEKDLVKLRVDHHQGMLCTQDDRSELIAYFNNGGNPWPDYAIMYEDTKSLCFQPHPEWGHKGTEDYFFELIERYFGFVRKDTKCAA